MSGRKRENSIGWYVRLSLFSMLGLIISLFVMVVFSQVVTGISATMTQDTAMEVKKNMLYEYVNNMIVYLGEEKDLYEQQHPLATPQEVEEAMCELAHRRIYSETHTDGAYMWVQKVLDYNGGDHYAIRLIHPNLSDTEGCYLSTEEVNQMGMKAYEIELNGIKAEGEIYQRYAFKKLNSDEVTEKLTYAKLYEPFDWILCMGINLDDLEHYRLQAEEEMKFYKELAIIGIAVIWVVLLVTMLMIYRRAKTKRYEKHTQELKNKLNKDTLTGASSRAYGENLLDKEFEEFQDGKLDTLFLMMDIDFFKKFNDGYGHELGDKVLVAFVEAIRKCTRTSDYVIRWGGDEFIVILQGISRKALASTVDKILNSVREIHVDGLPKEHVITTSVGCSYFEASDQHSREVIGRADAALYRAKANGRDTWSR